MNNDDDYIDVTAVRWTLEIKELTDAWVNLNNAWPNPNENLQKEVEKLLLISIDYNKAVLLDWFEAWKKENIKTVKDGNVTHINKQD